MLRSRLFAAVFAGLVFSILFAGCGGSSSSTPAATPVSVTITITPVAMIGGATQTFTVTVSNDSTNAGVTWTASIGTITTAGVYTAPAVITTTSATITATSKADPTKSVSVTVPLTPISVVISITPVSMIGGATQTFTATVAADGSNSGVTWTASIGTITAAGVYTSPAIITTTSATITATSKTDPTKSVTVTVTLTPISVAITTVPVAMIGGATQTFVAAVTADGSNSGVTWTASIGTITAAGAYTAPAVITATSATITATSVKDPTKSASVAVTLTPISVGAINPASISLNGGGSQAFTVSVTSDGSSSGVTWSIGSGVGTLSNVTTTGVTYTAPAVISGTTAVTVSLVATSIKDPTKSSAAAVITLNPITITITTTPVAMIGGATQSFSATVGDDGSNSGVTWSVTSGGGSFSPTTTASAASTTYVAVSPVATTTAVLKATSVKDTTKSASVTVTLTPISVTITTTPVAMLGGANQTFAAMVTADNANAGVTWTASIGTITAAGVYTSPAIITTTSATITATSKTDTTKSASVTVPLMAISISFTTTTTGIVLDSGQTFALAAAVANDLSASGATFTASGAGTVAPFSATGNAPATVLTATGTTASSVTVTATSTQDTSKTAVTVAITVNPALAITTAAGALTAATTGSAYGGATIVASGGTGTKTFAIASGSLPPGLSLNAATGAITGTITGSAGVSTFTVKVTDTATTPNTVTSGSYTITVSAPPLVWVTPTTETLTYTVGTAITPITLTTSGGTPPVSFSLNSGTLPPGLSIVGGQLVGTPTGTTVPAGNVVTFLATDSAATPVKVASANITLIANPIPLVITTTSLPTGTVGSGYNDALTATGGTGTLNWSMSPTPVDGISLGTAGSFSGTPTAANASNVTITVRDSDLNQQQTKQVTLALNVTAALTVTSGTSFYAVDSTAFNTTLTAAGGSGTGYTWSVTSGASNLSAISLSLSTGGVITGTPTTSGAETFTVQVKDSASNTATANITITAYAAMSLPSPNPSSLGAATINQSYTGSISATGGLAPYIWTVNSSPVPPAGTLVALTSGLGLSVSNTGNGTLSVSGTPTSTGTVTFTASLKDSNGTVVGPFTYTINVTNALTITSGNSFNAPDNNPFTTTLTAAGGSGTGYTWSVTAGQSSLTALNLTLSSTGVLSGTPIATGTASFTVQVEDSASNKATGNFTVTSYLALSLPSPNPSSLPSATTTQVYNGSILAAGGISPYTWTVNGVPLPSNGSSVALTSGFGLTVASNPGSNILSVTGTPTSTGTVTFTASIKDSTGTVAGPFTYTIAVSTTSTVSGVITEINNACGSTSAPPAITVSINTTPVQTTTTDGSGNYSFTNVPNGTYTITPSIIGPSSVFYPATQSAVVSTSSVTANFSTTLGYTVSGMVAYSGSKSGQVYLTLNSSTCTGNSPGTSILIGAINGGVDASPASFTIRGVSPGAYTLQGNMDNLGYGAQNASNPTGNISVTVSNSNYSGATVTLADPGTVTLTSAPQLNGVSPLNTAALINYTPIENSNGLEEATSYTLLWSTSSSCTIGTAVGSKTFPATGDGTDVWVVNGLTNGSAYYFCAYGTSGGTAVSPYSSNVGPVTINAPTGGNAVSGAVTFTGAATGPLYVGYFDQNTGNFYGEYIASPTSPQAYTIQVPTGSNYFFVGILDQNKNGIVDAGDLNDIPKGSSPASTAITGPTTGENLALSSANSVPSLTTQNLITTVGVSSNETYTLNFQVQGVVKVPVGVTLVSGPNVLLPMDAASCSFNNGCGGSGYNFSVPLNTTSPSVGDAYGLQVTYSDGTSETLTATVTGVLTAFTTNLSPVTGVTSSTTPTFTWTYPASASSYTYSFSLNGPSGTIWEIPGNDSDTNGFSSSISPTITWDVDPVSGDNSTPNVLSLTVGTNYSWQIQVQDINGNQAVQQVNYQP